ncbi:MAG: hypothetical protein JWR36_1222 [Glaciihabitans sp.]|jgi:hypothetical protein|nr:hypothetical protein [Glaciihabitans sp.]
MCNEEMKVLAQKWWESDGSDDYFGRVSDILSDEPALAPQLLRAMVATGTPGLLSRIGTGPVEELQMNLESGYRDSPATLDLVIAADLKPDDLEDVLPAIKGM